MVVCEPLILLSHRQSGGRARFAAPGMGRAFVAGQGRVRRPFVKIRQGHTLRGKYAGPPHWKRHVTPPFENERANIETATRATAASTTSPPEP